MARHYYRTNVPLPIMIVWWVFLGACALIFMIYDAVFKAPERKERAEAQAQWERNILMAGNLNRNTHQKMKSSAGFSSTDTTRRVAQR
jgi:hypothetical protein